MSESKDNPEHVSGIESEEAMASFEVECLLQSRQFLGEEQYYVKWEGLPWNLASWEKKDTLLQHHDCKQKIKELKTVEKTREDALSLFKKQEKAGELEEKNVDLKDGFDFGLEAERILAACPAGDEIVYCVKWRGTDEADNLPSSRLKECCPQLLVEYLQQHFVFERRDTTESNDSGCTGSMLGEI